MNWPLFLGCVGVVLVGVGVLVGVRPPENAPRTGFFLVLGGVLAGGIALGLLLFGT